MGYVPPVTALVPPWSVTALVCVSGKFNASSIGKFASPGSGLPLACRFDRLKSAHPWELLNHVSYSARCKSLLPDVCFLSLVWAEAHKKVGVPVSEM
jgi:hypothetical protein